MINVLFFASIREELSTPQLSLEFEQRIDTVASVKSRLISEKGALWAKVLNAENVVIAVNQEVVTESQVLNDGDEVAFFPPVTGG